MNQLQQVEVAQNRLIAQIDAATTALEKIGRDPLNEAVERFEQAANRVKERFADAKVRVLKLAQSLIGDLTGMADGIAIDFTLTVEEMPAPQPIPVLPPADVVEVTTEQQPEDRPEPPNATDSWTYTKATWRPAEQQAEDKPEPLPVPSIDGNDGSTTISRLTEDQKNLVADLAAPPPGNGRHRNNKRKR